MKKITYKNLKLISNPIVIDVRDINEYNEFHILNAINIEYFELFYNYEKYISKTKTYYLICKSGYRSKKISKKLNKLGYKTVYIVKGIDSIKFL